MGGCTNQSSGRSQGSEADCGCSQSDNAEGRRDDRRGREEECGCNMMPPPWSRSGFGSQETCGCEGK